MNWMKRLRRLKIIFRNRNNLLVKYLKAILVESVAVFEWNNHIIGSVKGVDRWVGWLMKISFLLHVNNAIS